MSKAYFLIGAFFYSFLTVVAVQAAEIMPTESFVDIQDDVAIVQLGVTKTTPVEADLDSENSLTLYFPDLVSSQLPLASMLDVDAVGIDQDGRTALRFQFGRTIFIQSMSWGDTDTGSVLEVVLNLGSDVEKTDAALNDAPLILKVAVDPGHGGADPGAIRGADLEKELVLVFAEELELALFEHERFDPFLVRTGDSFVPLDERRRRSRDAGADVFLSFHADAIVEGQASGLTVYSLRNMPRQVLSNDVNRFDTANDLWAADAAMPEQTLVSLTEFGISAQRSASNEFSQLVVSKLSDVVGVSRSRPNLEADFAVLKNSGMVSILIELGFITNTRDLAQLKRQDWRANAIAGIISALELWADRIEAK